MLLNPYVLLGALLAAVVGLAGAYLQGRSDGKDVCVAQEARDNAVTVLASEAAASAVAAAISKIEVKNVTVMQKLQREVIEREVFRDCRSGPDAVRLFNSAIPGAPEQPTPAASELPASHPAK